MNATPSEPPRRGLAGRPVLTVTIALAALIGAGLGGVALANRGDDLGPPRWQTPAGAAPAASSEPSEEAPAAGAKSISLSATGDIIMGSAPNKLPANGGEGFFDDVAEALKADLVMGNLEQPLTGDTGTSKCGTPPRPNCFAFRAPPEYAAHLKDAGFELLNMANNHGKDYGPVGFANTQKALEAQGLAHTGAEGEIATVEVEGITVAVVGFASYAGLNLLTDIGAAEEIVKKADEEADLVVVQVHMGAEGADKTRVKPGTETFFGENRGDPMKFSRAVIDAGADLVVGHGPHVLRGMEFYNDRLIAYSLGNFAGGGKTLSRTGRLGWGGVLKVSLTKDGAFTGGEFLSTRMNSSGVPTRDTDENGRELVNQLSADDFGADGVKIGDDGKIAPRS
ncbi:CapA family protein [Spirilliplanes yamanashiensis]|uniref:Metallophosphatase n=1 Tax=Spirilliplanes yamanashiensis TaxID=42233 RepID=A0A8J3Y6L9_9ACTN|nr:CapA family protein [Spirilliplanes yamanashiensis]MDP9814621.1 poly-gamma-glutamate capsule biosynthesis protein CapA/YwtB (metallophosphatase superfamily) [Spirilliplanes yamanashiensis]GIJ02273.1 metallophosphatase [Spirilliplanes yamanashiensis]